ncbi:MAG: hypothetical protein IAG13_30785, partial [Deltaproteobacteria bacterium]|nr:hypothetical protein [Nannocystaceae bacterium]
MLVARTREWILGASLCAAGCTEDPFDFGGPRTCEAPDQNEWLYGLMQDGYLWSDEMPEIDPASFESPSEMIAALRVDPDRWSRVADKAKTNKLFEEGKTVGYGFSTRRDLLGRLAVAYVTPDSPADKAGMVRGDILETIGGFTIAQIDEEERWGDVYGPGEPGVEVSLAFTDRQDVREEVTLVKDWVTIETVPISSVHTVGRRKVGYLLFATFVDTAPARLDETFAEF